MKSDHTNYYHFSNLPSHVLVNVLLRLTMADFKNAVQTCTSWYFASCDPQIARHILVNGLRKTEQIEYARRPIYNLRLNKINMNKFSFRKLLANFGDTITYIELCFSTLAFTRLFEIFVYLPNVRTLRIYLVSNYLSAQNFSNFKPLHRHRDTISRNLAQIKNLSVHSRMRDLQRMKLLLGLCKNIETLHWNERIYLPHNQIDFICDYLLDSRENPVITKITDLLIGCIKPDDNYRFLTKLINESFTNLRRLHIKEISQNYDVVFREFCRTYNYLEDFTMNRCDDLQLNDICKYMQNLKSLRLENCGAPNLGVIAQLARLETLNLERVDITRDDKLIELLSLKLPNLKNLTINFIEENTLIAICENCKNLELLDLQHVITKNCEPIFRHLLNLRVLKLWFTMPAPCNSSHLDIMEHCNITRLTKLEELCVSCWVPGITPMLVRKLPRCRKHCIDSTWDRTDEEFAAWAIAMERRDEIMAHYRNPPPVAEDPVYELTDFDPSLYTSILQ